MSGARVRLKLPEFPADTVCHYCSNVAYDWDHVIPMSLMGPDAEWNLVPACNACNQGKKDSWPDIEDCQHCMEIVARFILLPGHLDWAIDSMERRIRLNHKTRDTQSLERMQRLTRTLAHTTI